MPIRLLLLVDIAVEEAFSSKPVNAPQIVRRTSVVGARLRCAFDRFLAQTACSWDRPRKGAQGRVNQFAEPPVNDRYLRIAVVRRLGFQPP
jgi:hypothetical protein